MNVYSWLDSELRLSSLSEGTLLLANVQIGYLRVLPRDCRHY